MHIKINWRNTAAAAATLLALLVLPFANPCEAEDSLVCTWNASEQGNRVGSSFTNFYGVNLYHLKG